MTETCGIISIENTKIGSHHSGSTGVLVPGVESQIIDINSKKSLPPFHKGEIWVRGQNMMQGYLKNSKATTETIDKQGWCKSYQVAPAELEELLLTHPEITDAAVIPFPDAEAGEVPIAYIVRSSNSSLSQEEVKRFIAEQVAPFKRLRRVIFIDNIPKSASGKILRRELRQKNLSKL
ncbi:unnamed protein product [Fraxinus pennsylvanica]|uniref:Uncharacterized protein n=1 Tax=Fraxinus pennsylvanica TaxID=56036 RepID=A0AAD2A2K3_9LAMI|nr:unnamed protein product [Fraxinus pennsylvanica]